MKRIGPEREPPWLRPWLRFSACSAAAPRCRPRRKNRWRQKNRRWVTTVEGITEYQLDNGLRVLLFPDQSKQQITVNITYLVGSRHEGYGETGMAHLLEHLVFKGTPNHPDIPAELTERGAFPNGTTWFDRTNYFETFPATDDNLEWALDLEADRMINSFIAAEDLESEMTVVRNEWERGENSPSGGAAQTRHVRSVRLAQLRQLHHRREGGYRGGSDRPAAGLLPQVLPAGQRHPGRRRPLRSRARPGPGCREVRRHSTTGKDRRQPALSDLHGGTGTGRRAQRDAAAGRGCATRHGRVSRPAGVA